MDFSSILKSLPPPSSPSSVRFRGSAGALVALALFGAAVVATSASTSAVRVGAGLALVTALAIGSLSWFSRRARSTPPPPLHVISRVSLSPRCGLAMVDAEGTRLVLAFGDGFATLLSTSPAAERAPAAPPAGELP